MDELESIRRRKLIELQRQQQEAIRQQAAEEQEAVQQIERLEESVRPFLSKEALVRYGTLKSAHGEKALQALVILAQAIQQKKIARQLSDEEFKEILKRMEPKKRDITIKRI